MNDKIWSTIFILHVIFVRFLYQGYAVVVKKKERERELSVSILWKTLSKIGDIFLNACLVYKITCVCVCVCVCVCLCMSVYTKIFTPTF